MKNTELRETVQATDQKYTLSQLREALKDGPVGRCPACGELVYNALETDGPVWTCPRDLSPTNKYWMPSDITEADMEKDQVWSSCYEDHDGWCGDHMPMHSACYDKGEY